MWEMFAKKAEAVAVLLKIYKSLPRALQAGGTQVIETSSVLLRY